MLLSAAVDPPHPGETFSELWLGTPGISITATAAQLKISRKTLSEIVNARVTISVEMGLASGKSAESWLGNQSASDLWQLKGQRKQLGVKQHKQGASIWKPSRLKCFGGQIWRYLRYFF